MSIAFASEFNPFLKLYRLNYKPYKTLYFTVKTKNCKFVQPLQFDTYYIDVRTNTRIDLSSASRSYFGIEHSKILSPTEIEVNFRAYQEMEEELELKNQNLLVKINKCRLETWGSFPKKRKKIEEISIRFLTFLGLIFDVNYVYVKSFDKNWAWRCFYGECPKKPQPYPVVEK